MRTHEKSTTDRRRECARVCAAIWHTRRTHYRRTKRNQFVRRGRLGYLRGKVRGMRATSTTLVKISLRPTMTCAWKNNDLWFPHKPACRGYKRFTSQTDLRLVGENGVDSVRHGWDRPARGPAAPPKSLWPGSEYTGSSWRLGRSCTQTRWRAAVCATVQKILSKFHQKIDQFSVTRVVKKIVSNVVKSVLWIADTLGATWTVDGFGI